MFCQITLKAPPDVNCELFSFGTKWDYFLEVFESRETVLGLLGLNGTTFFECYIGLLRGLEWCGGCLGNPSNVLLHLVSFSPKLFSGYEIQFCRQDIGRSMLCYFWDYFCEVFESWELVLGLLGLIGTSLVVYFYIC